MIILRSSSSLLRYVGQSTDNMMMMLIMYDVLLIPQMVETAVKNCNASFHSMVGGRDFLQEVACLADGAKVSVCVCVWCVCVDDTIHHTHLFIHPCDRDGKSENKLCH